MLDEIYFNYTENEMNTEKLIEIETKHKINYAELNLTDEQINYIDEIICDREKAFFKLGFKACFNFFKEMSK